MPDNSNLEEVVVLGASTLSFVYLNKYTRLVVGVGGEDQTSWWGRYLSLLRGVTGKDGSLDCGTIGNRVDALVRLFVVEEVGNEFDNTEHTG
jgi:hypothetical protein